MGGRVVGPHFSGALIARDLGDPGPDRDRRFDFRITYDRDLVLNAALSLFDRITPVDQPLAPSKWIFRAVILQQGM